MESFNGVTLLLIFICSLIAFPAIGLACGTIMTILCEYVLDFTKSLFKNVIENNDSLVWNAGNQNANILDIASVAGLKIFYILCTFICAPVLLVLLFIAAFAYFGPLLAAIALFWTYSPVSMQLLAIASGIFIINYAGIMMVAAFRTTH